MPYTVAFDPTVGSIQAQIIPDATAQSDGVMTELQVQQLAALVAGGGGGLNSFSQATRPTPAAALAAVPGASVVQGWNTTIKAAEYSDGVHWYDADGNITDSD